MRKKGFYGGKYNIPDSVPIGYECVYIISEKVIECAVKEALGRVSGVYKMSKSHYSDMARSFIFKEGYPKQKNWFDFYCWIAEKDARIIRKNVKRLLINRGEKQHEKDDIFRSYTALHRTSLCRRNSL